MYNVIRGIKALTRTRHVNAHELSKLRCLVAGEDRKSRDDILDTTGEFIIDEPNELGFDVGPNSVRPLVRFGVRAIVPHSVLMETNSAPLDFTTLDWSKDSSSEEVILTDGRVAAATKTIVQVQQDEKTERLSLGLLIICLAFALMCLIIVGKTYL